MAQQRETIRNVITRAQAHALGLKFYFSGKPCNRGHVDLRYVSGSRCVTCAKDAANANPNKKCGKYKPADKAAYYQANKERITSVKDAYRAKQKGISLDELHAMRERRKIRSAERAAGIRYTPEQIKAQNKRRAVKHKDYILATNKARKLAIKQAMPSWTSYALLRVFYRKSIELTMATGINHHVDHIVPISSPLVCGLHSHHNLQVLPGEDNLSKSNKFDPETFVHTLPDES